MQSHDRPSTVPGSTDPGSTDPGTTDPGPIRRTASRAAHGERGEGVISTAIAVLIIAFLGVAMWAGFQAIFSDATARTGEQIQQIGR